MKQFFCGEVVPGCTASFQGNTEEDVLQQIAVHAERDHQITEIPDSLVAQIQQLIRTIPNA